MHQYHVFCSHDICEDSYTKGEMGSYNSWDEDDIISAETPMDAVITFYKKNLFWDFVEGSADFDEGALFDSRLVDEDSQVASEQQIEDWKAGKIQLYSDNVRIDVKQLVPVNLEK